MKITIENIKKVLTQVKFPGYNRDIISFGLVKDLKIIKDTLYISLSVKTDDKNNKKLIEGEIESVIKENFNLKEVKINFLIDTLNEKQLNKLNIKNILAISSCKGGVGKSTIALNIALEISKNYKVGLLDLDIYGPSLSTLINFSEQPKFDGNKIYPIDKFGIKLMSFGFINNENSPTIWRGPMVSRMTQQFFDNVEWGNLDYLILDLPPGTGDIQLTLVQKIALDGAIIVTTPQQLANIDVKKGSDMFNKVKTPIIGVIENMSGFYINGNLSDYNNNQELNINNQKIKPDLNGDFNFKINIFKGASGKTESERLDLPLLGQIGLDPKLSECCDNGTPYVLKYKNTLVKKEFEKISNFIISQNKK